MRADQDKKNYNEEFSRHLDYAEDFPHVKEKQAKNKKDKKSTFNQTR